MQSPSKSLATLRPDLAMLFMEWNLEMSRRGFIAQEVLPVREVGEQRGTLPHIPLEQLLKTAESRRNSNGAYNRTHFTFGDKSYACEEHGIEVPIDDRNAKIYRNYFDAESVAAILAYLTVLTNAEKRAAALLFNTSTWTGSALATTTGTSWNTLASAVPVDDVAAAKQKIWNGSGLIADAGICSYNRFEKLRRVAQIKTDIASAGAGSPQTVRDVTPAMVARALGLERLIIAGGPKNNANEAKARSLASIWDDDYFMVAKLVSNPNQSEIDPGLGITAHWAEDGSEIGGLFETYRDETIRADVARARHEVDELVLYKEAAHLIDVVP